MTQERAENLGQRATTVDSRIARAAGTLAGTGTALYLALTRPSAGNQIRYEDPSTWLSGRTAMTAEAATCTINPQVNAKNFTDLNNDGQHQPNEPETSPVGGATIVYSPDGGKQVRITTNQNGVSNPVILIGECSDPKTGLHFEVNGTSQDNRSSKGSATLPDIDGHSYTLWFAEPANNGGARPQPTSRPAQPTPARPEPTATPGNPRPTENPFIPAAALLGGLFLVGVGAAAAVATRISYTHRLEAYRNTAAGLAYEQALEDYRHELELHRLDPAGHPLPAGFARPVRPGNYPRVLWII